MKACIIGWLILGLMLAGLSAITQPYLNNCSPADNAFAHEYAGEMAAHLEELSQAAISSSPSPDSPEFFWAAEEEFSRRKHAAVYLKGDLAGDFVYAFSWAEAWCYYAGRAARQPTDPRDTARAGAALARAKAEFSAIRNKEYKK